MPFQIKEVAQLSGVSVRTLRYYDAIDLLRPASKSPAGYRLYADEDLTRLQQILFFRELGFPLRQIKMILDRPDFDQQQALVAHRQALLERQARLARLVRTIDRTLAAMAAAHMKGMKDMSIGTDAMFDGFDPTRYEDEVRQRWGHTEAYRQSQERTRKYTAADWQAIRHQMNEIESHLASLLSEGRTPNDPDVQAWIERHHRLIDGKFYSCSLNLFRGLGNLYVDDPRFTAHYEQIRPGLARFVHDAINVYCDVAGRSDAARRN